MGDKLIMSAKERKRKVICEDIKHRRLTIKEGGERMGVCERQARRIYHRYCSEGDKGLVHRSRGRQSPRAYPESFKAAVLQRYKEKYDGFGPTFAAEKLSEDDGYALHAETLRLWLKAAGLWTRRRRHKGYRRHRERKASFGELIQIDGSDHHWFGPDHPRSCLLNMVDDATGTTMAQMASGETTEVVLRTLWLWIKRYGIPKAVYVDLKSVYISPCGLKRKAIESEERETWSEFERVCQELDIKVVKAYSPQAKGRVERNHSVYQDRFVKELALKSITCHEDANQFLLKYYLPKINKKLAQPASSDKDAHRSAEAYGSIEQILCWKETRQVKNDYTIQFHNEHYQVMRHEGMTLRPKSKVEVHRHLSGRLSLWHDCRRLKYSKLKVAPKAKAPTKQCKVLGPSRSEISRRNKHKTPWGLYRGRQQTVQGT